MMRLALTVLCAVGVVGCATIGAGSEPIAPPKDYSSDGFRAEVEMGCSDPAACNDLLARAEERRTTCYAEARSYKEEHDRRRVPYRDDRALCPGVDVDVNAARELADAANEQAHGERQAAASTEWEADKARRKREAEEAARLAAIQAAEDAEMRRTEAARRAAELETMARDAIVGWSAASIRLCDLQDGLKSLRAEQAQTRRVDAASGTVDLVEKRDMAEAIIDYQDTIGCLKRAIQGRWKKAPAACKRSDELKTGEVIVVLDSKHVTAMEENCE
jgi:hypothetical protein